MERVDKITNFKHLQIKHHSRSIYTFFTRYNFLAGKGIIGDIKLINNNNSEPNATNQKHTKHV